MKNEIIEKLTTIKRNVPVGIIFLLIGIFLLQYGVRYVGSMCVLFIFLGYIKWSAVAYGIVLLVSNVLILTYSMLKIFGNNN